MSHLRRYLTARLIVWVPLGVTLAIIKFLADLMDDSLLLLPRQLRPQAWLGFHLPGLGAILTFAVVLLTGMVAANFAGERLVRFGEQLLGRIPLVRTIYSSVKQLMESFFSKTGASFRKVVLIEYPRAGAWTVAFLTSETQGEAQRKVAPDAVNVYVPTTPNPTSGFFLIVPRKDVIELDMSVDDALRMVLSTGVVVPTLGTQRPVRVSGKL